MTVASPLDLLPMFRAALPRLTTYLPYIAILAALLLLPTIVFAQVETVENYAPGGLGGVLYFVFTTIGGLFTLIGGNLLDFAIGTLVIGMGDLLRGNIGVAVDTLWQIIRDLFNILFIFGLIWIGLQTILRIGSNNLQRTLGGLIVAALLINFSLFITKAVIDFSNIAAVQIYNTGFGAWTGEGSRLRAPISETFMQNMQLNSYATDFIETPEDAGLLREVTDFVLNPRAIGFGFLIMVIQIIAGFVFLSGAILLIYRFVALIAYMIFSPAMFVGLIFDKFMTYQRKWWQGFLANAFVAPAYLFMIYLSAVIFVGINGSFPIETATFNEVYSAQGVTSDTFALLLFFAVMIGFLIASTMVAKQMGAAGASTVMKVGGVGANYFRQAGRNMGNAAYRNTAGRYYQGSADRLQEAREKKAANMPLSARDRLSLASARVSGAGSLDTAAASYKTGAGATPFGEGVSRTQMKANQKALKSSGARRAATAELVKKIEDGSKKGNAADIEQAFSDMTNPQLLEIAKTDNGMKLINANAQYLSGSQFKALADSDDINDVKTGKIAASRQSGMATKYQNSKDLKKAGKDDLSALGQEFLKKPENAVWLKDDQIKNLDLVDSYKDEIKTARKTGLTQIVVNGANIGGLTAGDIAKMNPSDIADLPDEVFGTNTNGQNGNVQSFINELPFSAITELAKRKNQNTQKIIKPYLQAISIRQDTRGNEMRDWLNNDTVGRRFGQ